MFCPECGTQNPDGSKFCSSCATQLPLAKPTQDMQHGQGPLGTKVMPPVTNPTPPSPTNPYGPPPDAQNYGGYSNNLNPNYQQNPYPQPQQQQYQNPYPQPQYQQFPQSQGMPTSADKPSGKAVAAGVLGIASIFLGLCMGIGVIMGAIGAVLGKAEMDAIARGQSPRSGELLAKLGFFCGIAGAVISFLAFGSCMLFGS